MINKTLYRKIKIEPHESHEASLMNSYVPDCIHFLSLARTSISNVICRGLCCVKGKRWLGFFFFILVELLTIFRPTYDRGHTCDAYSGREQIQYCKKYIQDRRRSRPTTAKTFDWHVSFMENYVWTIQINIFLIVYVRLHGGRGRS
jgi:hypothetical protein